MEENEVRCTEEALAYLEVGVGPIRLTLAAFDGDRLVVAEVTKRSLGMGEASAAWRQLADLAGGVAQRCGAMASAAGREVKQRGAQLLPVARELVSQAEVVQQ